MKKLTCLLLISFSIQCTAQYTITKLWDKTLGGFNGEGAVLNSYGTMKCFLINDGRIVICGISGSQVTGNKTQPSWFPGIFTHDSWLVAVDGKTGQKLWDRRYGGFYDDAFEDITPIGHSQHLLTLTTFNYPPTNGVCGDYTVPDTYVPNVQNQLPSIRYLLLDSNWNVKWDKIWSGNGAYEAKKLLWQDTTYCLLLWGNTLTNSDLVDTNCCSTSNGSGTVEKIVVACYDSAGNWKWDKPYGARYSGNRPVDLVPNGNGYLLLSNAGGIAPDCDITDTSLARDVNIYSVDSVGNVLWQRFYGGVDIENACRSLIKTSDGNFLFAASSRSPQGGEVTQPNPAGISSSIWVVKINPTGGVIWDKRYGSCNGSAPGVIIKTKDNGYLIGATAGWNDQIASCDVSENGFGLEDYWLLKLDSAGNKQWDKRWGGSGVDILYEVMQLPDGSYIASGISKSDSSGSKSGHNWDTSLLTGDYWVVHFKADKVVGLNEFAVSGFQLAIVPNPAKNICNITCPVDNGTLLLYDITGRRMLQQTFNQKTELDVSKLNSGIYIIEIKDKYRRIVKGKVFKN